MNFTALEVFNYFMSGGFLVPTMLPDPALVKALVELVAGGFDVATALIVLGTALVGLLTTWLSTVAAAVTVLGTWLALQKRQRDTATPAIPDSKRHNTR